ncbi:MAG TPA: DUF2321 domain-containing protein [Chloroflexota bacterium]|nr:DUF2321 domain-containing protein [Chloroflexota bacterium]
MGDSHYDVAQICRNGHVTNSTTETDPESNQPFCSSCGEETVTTCDNCHASIRGTCFYDNGFFGYVRISYQRPAFCLSCGNSFPWTTRKLAAAKELATTFDQLSEAEQLQLQESVDDLANNTPRTKAAESRFKRLLKKAGTQAGESMRGIVIEVVSETVKKTLFEP